MSEKCHYRTPALAAGYVGSEPLADCKAYVQFLNNMAASQEATEAAEIPFSRQVTIGYAFDQLGRVNDTPRLAAPPRRNKSLTCEGK